MNRVDDFGRVAVVGLGYIGLPTSVVLARTGFNVLGVDINPKVIETLRSQRLHIIEPGLQSEMLQAVNDGKLEFSSSITNCDVVIVCVPTPFEVSQSGEKRPDLKYVLDVAAALGAADVSPRLVILESTCPVGATEIFAERLKQEYKRGTDFRIAYCPERVLPGNVLHELVCNDRVVGGIDDESTELAHGFYSRFVTGRIHTTNSRTAEMCKLTENSFRDLNIAFANELSLICDDAEVDVWELIKLANCHPRVDILSPGVGVGGHCIAVDPWFLVSQFQENSALISLSRSVNDRKPLWVADKIKTLSSEKIDKRIVCWGVAFKPDIDDFRNSPAMQVVTALINEGHDIVVVEPNAEQLPGVTMVSIDEALILSGLHAVLVKHSEFSVADVRTQLLNLSAADFCGLFATH